MSKAGKIVSKAGTVVLCLVLVLAIIFVVFQVFASTGRALPGGYRPLIVLSGSMKPVMPVGSVVVSKSVDAASVKVGDIVTYAQASDPTGKTSPFITHRVAKVIQGTSGLSFVTKGDANNTDDQNPVPASRIVGRVVLIMPSVGRVTQFVHSPLGLILLILLPGAILIAWEGIGLVNRRGKSAKAGGNTAAVLLFAIMGMGAVAMATGSSISGTEAYFVTASNSIGFSISTGTWGPTQPNLTLSPGTSTATRQDHCPVVFPIASQEPSGKLTLDFGELNPGDCTDWTDVFRIENAGAQDAHVNVVADGAIKPWISARHHRGRSPAGSGSGHQAPGAGGHGAGQLRRHHLGVDHRPLLLGGHTRHPHRSQGRRDHSTAGAVPRRRQSRPQGSPTGGRSDRFSGSEWQAEARLRRGGPGQQQ
jgi:signal peptidase